MKTVLTWLKDHQALLTDIGLVIGAVASAADGQISWTTAAVAVVLKLWPTKVPEALKALAAAQKK